MSAGQPHSARAIEGVPRVALFADSFLEVNGLALTCRQLHEYARRRGYPIVTFHAGPDTRRLVDGTAALSQLACSRLSIPLDVGLYFDPLFLRHYRLVRDQLAEFRPDVVHYTAPSHCGVLGAIAAKRFGIARVASWHTNIHEFGSLRLASVLSRVPERVRQPLCRRLQDASLAGLAAFYRTARLVLAPNEELASLLAARTRKPTRIMGRGVDTELFSPHRRTRTDDGTFRIGFVGRLSAEKNVRLLRTVERALLDAGHRRFTFVIVGQGAERPWLEAHMQHAEFPGLLEGLALASAYANLDLFVFPSHSDTFGNVVQEAHASGVPAIVTNEGGPRFLVADGVDGFVARDDRHFVECVLKAMAPETNLPVMRLSARRRAEDASWDRVFDTLYQNYAACLSSRRTRPSIAGASPDARDAAARRDRATDR
ncbi:MAG: glycosyltransferase [Vicinamibacterales bacterium]